MRKTLTFLFVIAGSLTWADDSGNWPQFRGPSASGVSEGAAPPFELGRPEQAEPQVENAHPPGSGTPARSSGVTASTSLRPISGRKEDSLKVGLYGDIKPVEDDSEHEWKILALDKNSGRVLWEKTAHRGVPKIKRHTKATHANSTMATDGKRLVAFFGSEGLYAWDMDGELLWKKDLGVLDSGFFRVPEAQWEFASSPILHDGKVIVQCDVQKDSFVAAFDAATGKELWRTAREEVADLEHTGHPHRQRQDTGHPQRLEAHRRL